MLKTFVLPALAASALVMTLAACQPTAITPDTDGETTIEAPVTEAPEGDAVGDRTDYTEVPVPEGAVGADPAGIAIVAFGSTDHGEGNWGEEVELVDQTDDQALVLLTQTGLADDSVDGMRYRLEFVPEGDQWRLAWAGRQVRCQPNRGSQEWSTDLCS